MAKPFVFWNLRGRDKKIINNLIKESKRIGKLPNVWKRFVSPDEWEYIKKEVR